MKTRVKPTSFEIEPIFMPIKNITSTRNTSWVWAREWYAYTHRMRVFTIRTYTHYMTAHYARLHRP